MGCTRHSTPSLRPGLALVNSVKHIFDGQSFGQEPDCATVEQGTFVGQRAAQLVDGLAQTTPIGQSRVVGTGVANAEEWQAEPVLIEDWFAIWVPGCAARVRTHGHLHHAGPS